MKRKRDLEIVRNRRNESIVASEQINSYANLVDTIFFRERERKKECQFQIFD